MNDFVECRTCEFVLYAERSSEPKPKGRDACPNCDGTEFRFLDD